MNCLVVPKGFSRTLLHFLDTPGGQPSPTNPGAMREPLKMRERAPGLQTPLLLNDMAETQSRALHSREGQAPHPSPSPAVGVWLEFLIWAHVRPWCAQLFEARLQVPRIERELLDVSNCLEVCAPLRRALAFVLSREIKPAFRQRRPRVGFRNFLRRPIPLSARRLITVRRQTLSRSFFGSPSGQPWLRSARRSATLRGTGLLGTLRVGGAPRRRLNKNDEN